MSDNRYETFIVFGRMLRFCDRFCSRICGHPLLGKLFLSGWILLILPFVVYFFQRFLGIVPNQAEWFKHGILEPNHGPWHMQPENLLVLYPFLFLIPFTVLVGFVLAIRRRRFLLFFQGLWIALMLIAMASFQLEHLIWLID